MAEKIKELIRDYRDGKITRREFIRKAVTSPTAIRSIPGPSTASTRTPTPSVTTRRRQKRHGAGRSIFSRKTSRARDISSFEKRRARGES